MKKVFLLIPLLSLFVFGCNDSQNNDVEQLALIASNKISSLEQSNNQLKEEFEKELSITGYLWKSGVPVGTYGDWTLTNDYAKYNKYFDNIYITDGTTRFKLIAIPVTYCALLPIPQSNGPTVVYRATVELALDNSETSFDLICDIAFRFKEAAETDNFKWLFDSVTFYPYAIDYKSKDKIDLATLDNVWFQEFFFEN